MAIGFGIGDIENLAGTIHDLHDKIAAEPSCDDNKRVPTILDSSTQKLDLWIKTWLGSQVKNSNHFETLWGNNGWIDIQKLLEEIKVTSQQFQPPDESQQELSQSKPWWRRSPWVKQNKKTRDGAASRTLETASELEKQIDQLWAYTEVIFDSLHRLIIQQHEKSVECDSGHFVAACKGALSLFRAAQASHTECLLVTGVVNQSQPMEIHPDTSEDTHGLKCDPRYWLLTGEDEFEDTVDQLDLENILIFTQESTALKPNKPKMQVFQDASPDEIIRVKTKASESLFKIINKQTVSSRKLRRENLDSFFNGNRKPSGEVYLSPSLLERFELALSLAQSCFTLIGTPWLVNLSSEKLERVQLAGEEPKFCWTNSLSSLEKLVQEDKGAISESSQLFRLGAVLMEIPLGGIDHEDFSEMDNPLVWATQQLPDVQMVAGAEYSKACEFCIKDHGAIETFERPDKYNHAEQTGWNIYLRDLLVEYETEVLSR